MTFAIGPAGTGKTYLAVAAAVRALQERQVSRLILTRPAVEAGERLGFLPGTLYEKIDPYMRPLYDALYEMTGPDTLPRLMERGTVEVAPLAFMRGRTLNDAFIILDEAQNTTPEQMKMFLTRLGFGSKAVVNGDATQIDLPTGRQRASAWSRRSSADIEGIAFVPPGRRDVVRHKIVQDIVEAYGRFGQQRLAVDDVNAHERPRRTVAYRRYGAWSPTGRTRPVDEVGAGRARARDTLLGEGRRRRRAVAVVRGRGRDGGSARAVHGRGRADRRPVFPLDESTRTACGCSATS